MDALAYHVPNPDDIVICPYNKSHAIEVKRMQYHLMKCRRQHIGQDFVTCPFNAKHEMPKVELRYHITTCPDKNRIVADLAYEASKNGERGDDTMKGCTDVPSYEYDFELPESSEDWDAETLQFPRVGIHPSTLNNSNIIRTNVGLTPSEKRAFEQNLFNMARNGGVLETEPTAPNEGRLRIPQSAPPLTLLANRQNLPTVGVGRGVALPRPGGNTDRAAMIMAMSLGRGRLLNQVAPVRITLGESSTSSAESQDDSGAENQTLEQKKREERKLQKKLRQIQLLEDKQDRGEELLPLELEKMAKREEIEMALKCLNLD